MKNYPAKFLIVAFIAMSALLFSRTGAYALQLPTIAQQDALNPRIYEQIFTNAPISYGNIFLYNVPSGYSITNGVGYLAWCLDSFADVSPGGTYFPHIYSSYDTAGLASAGIPTGNFDKLNYIINHKPLNATASDIQDAVWHYIGGGPGGSQADLESGTGINASLGFAAPNPTVVNAIIADADLNGAGYTPPPGGLIGVVLALPASLNGGFEFQAFMIEVQNDIVGPALKVEKSASKTQLAPYEPVIYHYVVTNVGGVTLSNITLTDDNGTPNVPLDDFKLTPTPITLTPGQSASYDVQVIPVVSTTTVVNGSTIPAGAIIVVVELANGDVQVTYLQDFGINDNTYGTGAIGWGAVGGHKFGDLTGSDKLEFRFFDKAGNVAIDFYVDCITQATSVKIPGTGQIINYPSGYGTLGPFGGDGSMVAGDPNKVISFSTSISDNLNNPLNVPKKAALIVNTPTTLVGGNVVVDTTKAPGGWDYINSYTAVVSGSAFTAGGGFGSVSVPDQHNSPNKLNGPHSFVTKVVDSTVMNTFAATSVTATNGTITATATASVDIVANTPLPAPWVTADIGAVAVEGSGTINGSTFTLTGSGADIGGSKDEFRYLYQAANGDCSIIAKVNSVEKTDNNAKGGVMIRNTLADNSVEASMSVTAASGLAFLYRTTAGGTTTKVAKAGIVAPYWVKLDRVGNNFTASYSANGTAWTVLATKAITMGTTPYIGLCDTSHKDGILCTTSFSNVTVTP